jgi:hypothetical protein
MNQFEQALGMMFARARDGQKPGEGVQYLMLRHEVIKSVPSGIVQKIDESRIQNPTNGHHDHVEAKDIRSAIAGVGDEGQQRNLACLFALKLGLGATYKAHYGVEQTEAHTPLQIFDNLCAMQAAIYRHEHPEQVPGAEP